MRNTQIFHASSELFENYKLRADLNFYKALDPQRATTRVAPTMDGPGEPSHSWHSRGDPRGRPLGVALHVLPCGGMGIAPQSHLSTRSTISTFSLSMLIILPIGGLENLCQQLECISIFHLWSMPPFPVSSTR